MEIGSSSVNGFSKEGSTGHLIHLLLYLFGKNHLLTGEEEGRKSYIFLVGEIAD